ncbi:MAG: multiheme c-type cytochrome [Bacteroidota bacterium]
MLKKLWFRVMAVLIVAALLFNQCMQDEKKSSDLRGSGYAGAATCIRCHADISNSYAATAHANSTSPATREHIAGSFHKDSNHYQYNPHIKVAMEERNGRFFQAAFQDGVEKAAFPFDVVIGSGRKAQTYLYWYGANAFQLPVTYSVAAKAWVNSPNYPSDKVRFDRMIPVGCFECHSSFIERTGIHEKNGYRVDDLNPANMIYGIDCERCHGPAAEHVNYQAQHPNEKIAKYITSYQKISNIQRLENCAACHSGIHEPVKKSPFLFKPGETLNDYFQPDTVKHIATELDVHGNQYQLLQASKCFKGSLQEMSCSSCHNPHKQERNNLQVLSVKCMSCHAPNSKQFCSFADKVGAAITTNCIDCHMPASPSKVITLQSEGQKNPTPNLVRSHLIAIYPEVAKKQLSHLKLDK